MHPLCDSCGQSRVYSLFLSKLSLWYLLFQCQDILLVFIFERYQDSIQKWNGNSQERVCVAARERKREVGSEWMRLECHVWDFTGLDKQLMFIQRVYARASSINWEIPERKSTLVISLHRQGSKREPPFRSPHSEAPNGNWGFPFRTLSVVISRPQPEHWGRCSITRAVCVLEGQDQNITWQNLNSAVHCTFSWLLFLHLFLFSLEACLPFWLSG